MFEMKNWEEIMGYLMFSKKTKMDLYPLQWVLAKRLKKEENKCAYLFDETGAGKTISAGNCILNTIVEHRNTNVNILIVCPANLTLEWYIKLMLNYGMEFKLWGNTRNDEHYLDRGGSNLVIVSYDVTSERDTSSMDFLSKQQDYVWDLIVFDEAHNMKGEARNDKATRLRANKCVMATATPVTNDWEELRKMMLDACEIVGRREEGAHLYKAFTEKKDSFFYEIPDDIVVTRNFKEIISNQEAKERVIQNIKYTISPENYARYISQMRGESALSYFYSYSNIWLALGDNFIAEDDKLHKFTRLVTDEVQNKKHKIIVFCRRKETVHYLQRALKELQIVCKGITAESFSSLDARKHFIKNTNKSATQEAQYDVLITIDTLLNEGYDMVSFDTIINYELPFTPAQVEQRFGRVDRMNSKKHTIYMYNFENTNYSNEFDGAFHKILDDKLLDHVLTQIPSKSLLKGDEIKSAVQNTYKYYNLYRDLEEEMDKYEKANDSKMQEPEVQNLIKGKAPELFELLRLKKAWSNGKSYAEVITEERRDKEKSLKGIFGKIPECLEEMEPYMQGLVSVISKCVLWKSGAGIKVMDIEEIKNKISESKPYQELQCETERIQAQVELFIEEVTRSVEAKGRKGVLAEIWNKLMEKQCNYVYCSMVMYNLWRTCFREMQYGEFITEVNELVYEE